MKTLLIILFLLLSTINYGQTFIEMISPEDANVILLEVKDSSKADIIIYITSEKEEANGWDCKWKFNSWGFSNFSIFIAKDSTQLNLDTNQTFHPEAYTIKHNGTVYFTKNPEDARYRNSSFRLMGVMRRIK